MNPISMGVRSLLMLTIASCALVIATAQTEKQKPTPSPGPSSMPQQRTTESPTPPAANPTDVASIDSIIAAVYDVISGPAGKRRDWDRMRSLFLPGARLIPTGPRQAGGYGSRVLTVDEYVVRAEPLFEKEGFFEREAARTTEQFGQIAHAFSTYESRHALKRSSHFNAVSTVFN